MIIWIGNTPISKYFVSFDQLNMVVGMIFITLIINTFVRTQKIKVQAHLDQWYLVILIKPKQ